MAYIGNSAQNQSYTPAVDFFSGDGSTVSFTLSRPVASPVQVQAVINNVPQHPGTAYGVSGNTITFSSAPGSGTNNIYIYYTSPNTSIATLPQSPSIIGDTTINGSLTVNKNVKINSTGGGSVTLDAPNTASNLTVTLPSASGTLVSTGSPFAGGTANGVAYLNGSKVLTTGSALTFNGTTLNFGGTAQRITGDFTTGGASITNRVYFQTSTLNGNTQVGVIPNGTATTSGFTAFSSSSDLSNSSFFQLALQNNTESRLTSGRTGTGTYLPLTFYTDGSEQMRLTSTGLGIGTSSNGAYRLAISGDSSSVVVGTNYIDTAASVGRTYSVRSDSGSFRIRDVTASSDRVFIDSSGNLGLGVTPSAWDNGGNLQLADSKVIAFSGYAGRINTNAYYNAGWKYIGTGTATQYNMQNGQHIWLNAPSGTAGNAISFTQAMTLDASGNLVIGATSGSNKLTVNGDQVLLANGQLKFADAANSQVSVIKNSGAATVSQMEFLTGNPPTERMRIDSSGNVGIGTSSPGFPLDVVSRVDNAFGVRVRGRSSDNISVLRFTSNDAATNYGQIDVRPNTFMVRAVANIPMEFWTNDTERMRIDSSGNLLVGTTSLGLSNSSSFQISGITLGAYSIINHASGTVSGREYAIFGYNSSQIGSITQNGTTAVAYNTSSDYRLKENIQPMQNALAVVAQLNPVTYTWKSDGSAGQGFIAHELQDVVPDCVTGTKDAVDEEGNPVYQGVDTSFLVATLTKAIQELSAKVDAQATEIAALKAK